MRKCYLTRRINKSANTGTYKVSTWYFYRNVLTAMNDHKNQYKRTKDNLAKTSLHKNRCKVSLYLYPTVSHVVFFAAVINDSDLRNMCSLCIIHSLLSQ